jgi:hypothetical protein
VNFPFIWSNIPAAPAYGVYSKACGSYQDFLHRGLLAYKVASESSVSSG